MILKLKGLAQSEGLKYIFPNRMSLEDAIYILGTIDGDLELDPFSFPSSCIFKYYFRRLLEEVMASAVGLASTWWLGPLGTDVRKYTGVTWIVWYVPLHLRD